MLVLGVDTAGVPTPAAIDALSGPLGGPVRVVAQYIGGPYPTTKARVQALLTAGYAVRLTYNGMTEANCTTYAQGRAHAARADAAATALGAPATVGLILDVEEEFPATTDCLCGWADGERAGPQWKAGGVYGGSGGSLEGALATARAVSGNAALMPVWLAAWLTDGSLPAVMPTAFSVATFGGATVIAEQVAGNWGGYDVDLVDEAAPGLWLPPQAFADVGPSNWAYRDIEYVAALGLMDGMPGGVFEPNAPVTRAQLAAVVARLAQKEGL